MVIDTAELRGLVVHWIDTACRAIPIDIAEKEHLARLEEVTFLERQMILTIEGLERKANLLEGFLGPVRSALVGGAPKAVR